MSVQLISSKNPSTDLAQPALFMQAGEKAAWRFLEFFSVNIRNKNTRAAYGQAAGAFLR
jgi:integrase/recombinase XerD